MKINKSIINGLGLEIEGEVEFDTLGLIDSKVYNTLSFIDNQKYINDLIRNKNITGVFCHENFHQDVKRNRSDIFYFECDDPRFYFYSLQNIITLKKNNESSFYSRIDNSANIHRTAFISEKNVEIGRGVQIHPNVTILENVIIGDYSIIRSGSVVGAEGFEHKRTQHGILSVRHDGQVYIGERVDIGANCAISKGFYYRNTIIGNDSKLDNLVHVAHGVQIGERCFLPASCMIAGSTTLGNDVWIGPGSLISSQIKVGDNAFVTIGSVVTKDIMNGDRVTGNFAINHNDFIKLLKHNKKIIHNEI